MKNIIKVYTVICLLIMCINSFGQNDKLEEQNFSRMANKRMLKNKTVLVIMDDSLTAYGKNVKKAFEVIWKETPVKFIKSTEIGAYIESKEYLLFAFAVDDYDVYYKQEESSPGHYFQKTKLIETKCAAQDSMPLFMNHPEALKQRYKHEDARNEKSEDQYCFQLFMCGEFEKSGKPHDISNLEVCYTQQVDLGYSTATNAPVKYYQS
jgi:hypothetical protein